jgi:hypothetical protein
LEPPCGDTKNRSFCPSSILILKLIPEKSDGCQYFTFFYLRIDRQKRFRGVNGNSHFDDAYWVVPINYTTEDEMNFDDTTPDFWLSKQSDTISFPKLADDDWLLVNIRRTGSTLVQKLVHQSQYRSFLDLLHQTH